MLATPNIPDNACIPAHVVQQLLQLLSPKVLNDLVIDATGNAAPNVEETPTETKKRLSTLITSHVLCNPLSPPKLRREGVKEALMNDGRYKHSHSVHWSSHWTEEEIV